MNAVQMLETIITLNMKRREPVHAPAKEIEAGDAAWYTPATNRNIVDIARVLRVEFEPSIYPQGQWMIFIAYWIPKDNGDIILTTTWASEQELGAI